MAVSYSKEQHAEAKKTNRRLVTIDTGGMCFQGPVSDPEHEELTRYLLDFQKRRREAEKPEAKP